MCINNNYRYFELNNIKGLHNLEINKYIFMYTLHRIYARQL